jgi:hypothetical protein
MIMKMELFANDVYFDGKRQRTSYHLLIFGFIASEREYTNIDELAEGLGEYFRGCQSPKEGINIDNELSVQKINLSQSRMEIGRRLNESELEELAKKYSTAKPKSD